MQRDGGPPLTRVGQRSLYRRSRLAPIFPLLYQAMIINRIFLKYATNLWRKIKIHVTVHSRELEDKKKPRQVCHVEDFIRLVPCLKYASSFFGRGGVTKEMNNAY